MTDEEIAIAETAASLSRHFGSALPLPDGGIITTTEGYAEFDSRGAFESALVAEAAKGIDAANSEGDSDPTPTQKRRLSSYAAKVERRRREALREAEAERREREKRAAFISRARDEARARVQELREMSETASAIDRAAAASRKALDPDAAHHRRPIVVIGLRNWGG